MSLTPRQQKLSHVLAARQSGIIVFEDIHDPHNAAAVLRSCDGFGFQTAHFIFETTKKYNPKKVGKMSSSSANKWLTIETYTSTATCYEYLRAEGYTIYATTLHPEKNVNLYTPWPTLGPKVALVFGNEHAGISAYAADQADYHLYIPMRGFVESFNISVCASLVLGELTRQRTEAGIERYTLPDSEKTQIKQIWK